MNNTLYKIRKVLVALFITGVTVVVLSVVLLAFPSVDAWVCRKIEHQLSLALNRPLVIDELQYFPLRTLSLKGVKLLDEDSTAIATAARIKASVEITSLFSSTLRFSQLDIDTLRVDIRQLSEDPLSFNVSTLGNDTLQIDNSSPGHSSFGISTLRLRNSEVSCRLLDGSVYSVKEIEGRLQDLEVSDAQSKVSVNNLRMLINDRKSFFSGNLDFHSDSLLLSSVKSYCGKSIANINSFCLSNVSSLDSMYIDYAGASTVEADIDMVIIDEPELMPYLRAEGLLTVGAKDIDFQNIDITFSNNTHAFIDGQVLRWKDARNGLAFCNLRLSDLTVAPRDFMQLAGVQLSPEVDSTMQPLSGFASLHGRTNDLKVTSHLSGNISNLFLDAKIHCQNNNEIGFDGMTDISYNPQNSSQLLLGKTGYVTDFVGLYSPDTDNSYAHVKGNASLLTLLGYTYHNVTLDCLLGERTQNFLVDFVDNNGNFRAVGSVDNTKSVPQYSLTFRADSLRLGALGLLPTMPTSVLDCKAHVALDGDNMDNADGFLVVDSLTFAGNADVVKLGRLDMRMKKQTEASNRTIKVVSDHLNVDVEGKFRVSQVFNELITQIHSVAPALVERPYEKIPDDTWMNLDVAYSDIAPLVQLVDTSLHVVGSGYVKGRINSADHSAALIASMDDVAYGNSRCEGLNVNFFSQNGDTSYISWNTVRTYLPAMGDIGEMHNENALFDNKLNSHVTWQKRSQRQDSDIRLLSVFSRNKYDEVVTQVNIDPSFVYLGPRRWDMPKSSIITSPYFLQVNDFELRHDDRFFAVNGKSSRLNPQDTLTVRINRFAISDVLTTTPEDKYSLDGDVSSLAYLNDLFGNVIVNCQTSIDNFIVDGDNLDHMDVSTAWRPESKNLDVDLGIVTAGRKCVSADGLLDLGKGIMDLDFNIDSMSVGFLNFYLDAAIENMRGTTSGKLRLHGPLDDVKLDARLCVHKTTLSVKQTLCDYTLAQNDSIILSPTRMDFNNLRFTDKYGNKGVYSGYITHNMFSGLRMYLDFNVTDLLVLETNEKFSPSYYGTVYGTGHFGITGITALCNLDIQAKTAGNSEFYVLPLQKSEIGQTDYIRFNTKSDTAENDEVGGFDLQKQQEGVAAQLQVEILPNAKIYAIVDPRSDNMLEARGDGKLNFDLPRDGAFVMDGTYIIDQGVYNFNLQNIVNKRFDSNKGSTVVWNGDPYDAIVDLVATYKTRASLYDLVQGAADESTADLKKRVPINCNLFLTEHLLNPNIRFEIEIPSSQNFSQYTFDQYVNTEEEMNRQVFSLLLAGRFYASQEAASSANSATGGASTTDYLGTTLSELMSNQFSNWISQNKYNVGMGVNYRPGDDVTNEEYEVAVQTGVLDNKIILSGNIGYGRDAMSESANEGSFIGDFDVEVKLNKSETLRAKAYTHSNNDVIYETSPTTQGIGISYRESFDTFRELLRKYFGWMRRKDDDEKSEK